MGERMEREFKLRIPSEGAFSALIARLGGTHARAVRQVNHFFDTRTHRLGDAHLALRLREEDERCTLALKGPPRGARGPLAIRPEEEAEVERALASEVLAGKRSPLEVIGARLASGSALLAEARARAGDEPLLRLGAFENERLRVGPLALPGAQGPPLVLELDRTRYPDGSTELELELELPAGASSAPVEAFLGRLFAELGIPLVPAPSKAERFFRILGPPGSSPASFP